MGFYQPSSYLDTSAFVVLPQPLQSACVGRVALLSIMSTMVTSISAVRSLFPPSACPSRFSHRLCAVSFACAVPSCGRSRRMPRMWLYMWLLPCSAAALRPVPRLRARLPHLSAPLRSSLGLAPSREVPKHKRAHSPDPQGPSRRARGPQRAKGASKKLYRNVECGPERGGARSSEGTVIGRTLINDEHQTTNKRVYRTKLWTVGRLVSFSSGSISNQEEQTHTLSVRSGSTRSPWAWPRRLARSYRTPAQLTAQLSCIVA